MHIGDVSWTDDKTGKRNVVRSDITGTPLPLLNLISDVTINAQLLVNTEHIATCNYATDILQEIFQTSGLYLSRYKLKYFNIFYFVLIQPTLKAEYRKPD